MNLLAASLQGITWLAAYHSGSFAVATRLRQGYVGFVATFARPKAAGY